MQKIKFVSIMLIVLFSFIPALTIGAVRWAMNKNLAGLMFFGLAGIALVRWMAALVMFFSGGIL